jgi:hypothetical protein
MGDCAFCEQFVKQLTSDPNLQNVMASAGLGGLAGVFVGVGVLMLVIIALAFMAGFYVYMAFVWMTIARKLKYDKPWLAWIPFANLFLLPILAKKHWAWGFFFLLPPVYLLFAIYWLWLIYEQRNYPGALSLIVLGHFVPGLKGIAIIANLIVFGLVAWKDKKPLRRPTKRKKR